MENFRFKTTAPDQFEQTKDEERVAKNIRMEKKKYKENTLRLWLSRNAFMNRFFGRQTNEKLYDFEFFISEMKVRNARLKKYGRSSRIRNSRGGLGDGKR